QHFTHPSYIRGEDGEYPPGRDIAVLVIEEPVGNMTGDIKTKVMAEKDLLGAFCTVSGYPGKFKLQDDAMAELKEKNPEKKISIRNNPFLVTMSGRIEEVKDKLLGHKVNTSQGQSGSAIVTFVDNSY